MNTNPKTATIRTIIKISLYIALGLFFVHLFDSLSTGVVLTQLLEQSIIGFIYAFVITAANAYYNDFITSRYPWELQPKKRLWFGALGAVILTVLAFGMVRFFIHLFVYEKPLADFLVNERFIDYLFALMISILVSAIFHAFYFYKALQDTKVKEQKIIAGTAAAKFDALKNQLDPHFLFNSLNVLNSLIEENPAQAQKFTTALSKVYRYVLEQKNKDVVPVDEELQFAKTYVKLLKMRFEDSIVVSIPDNCATPNAKIVPLSLQLLLENAVKHNSISATKPLHIRIYEEDDTLVVSNNLQEKNIVRRPSGVGLQNISQRYSLLGTRVMEIDKTATAFTAKLPMLTKHVIPNETPQEFLNGKRYQKATKRMKMLKGFYLSLITYVVVITGLSFLNYMTNSFPWVLFPAIGWGFAVVGQGLKAYQREPLLGKRWEERKLRELMEKEDF